MLLLLLLRVRSAVVQGQNAFMSSFPFYGPATKDVLKYVRVEKKTDMKKPRCQWFHCLAFV